MKSKKMWRLFAVLLVILLVSLPYVLIPNTLLVARVAVIHCNTDAGFRSLLKDRDRERWWPAAAADGYSFSVDEKLRRELHGYLENGRERYRSKMFLLPISKGDSFAIRWQCTMRTGLNPISRLTRYREAVHVADIMTMALSSMGHFLEDDRNLYGFHIRTVMSPDSALIVTHFATHGYPATEEIYRNIGMLRKYIAAHGARETNYPMMHVSSGVNGGYATEVAVPLDRELPASGRVEFRRFIPWKTLSGEIRGGAATAEHAMQVLHQYVEDHQKTTMAMAFQSLVTDRDKEADTSKWITRVVVPVP
jgi:hypothetical protein